MNFIDKVKDKAKGLADEAITRAKDAAADIDLDLDIDSEVIRERIGNLQERFTDESITATADGPLDAPRPTRPGA